LAILADVTWPGAQPLNQLCLARSLLNRIEGFVRPSLGLCCSISSLYTENVSLFW